MANIISTRNDGEFAKNTRTEKECLLTPKTFGARVGLGDATIRRMIKSGRLKALRLNSRVIRIAESEIARLKMFSL